MIKLNANALNEILKVFNEIDFDYGEIVFNINKDNPRLRYSIKRFNEITIRANSLERKEQRAFSS